MSIPWALEGLRCIDTVALSWSGLDAVRQCDWLSGYRWPLARDHTLDCVIHQHVGEPTPLSLSTAGMYAGELCATMGNYWYKSNWRNIPTSLWRGTEWSGGLVVLKRSFTVSLKSLDVLSGFCVGVVCWFGWFCFGFVFGHPVFCAFICSPTAWDQLTDHATCSIGKRYKKTKNTDNERYLVDLVSKGLAKSNVSSEYRPQAI